MVTDNDEQLRVSSDIMRKFQSPIIRSPNRSSFLVVSSCHNMSPNLLNHMKRSRQCSLISVEPCIVPEEAFPYCERGDPNRVAAKV